MNLIITKPLCFIDCESTGKNPASDRIVQVAIVKLMPDGSKITRCNLLNPGIPIPAEATEVHKITDEMVKDKPTFKQVSKAFAAFLMDSDLAGFGIINFDIPLLSEEFSRVGIEFPLPEQLFVDALSIFHEKEKRDLTAAVRFYLRLDMPDAHDALADTQASHDVFFKQLNHYPDLAEKTSIAEIAAFCKKDNRIDLAGKYIKNEAGEYIITFGKHKDKNVKVAFKDHGYYKWIMEKSDLSTNSKKVTETLYNWVNQKAK